MNDCIIFEGIQTNNLKNIDIALKKKGNQPHYWTFRKR